MILTVTLNPCVDLLLGTRGLLPHDTNRVLTREEDAGGKGTNLSRVAAELGAKTTACVLLGGGTGAHVQHVLEVQGVTPAIIPTQAQTRVNISVQDGSDRPPTTFNMRGGPVSDAEWQQALRTVVSLAAGARWVCLGGSLPEGVPVEAWRTLVAALRALPVRILLDADDEPLRLGLEAGPHLIKPNLAEASRLLGRPVVGVEDAFAAAAELRALLAARGAEDPAVIISMGADGAVAATSAGSWQAAAIPVAVRSTIGSGDSLLGGLLAAFAHGHDWAEALRWGIAAGAATAMTDGTEIARRAVVQDLLARAVVVRRA
ncbi:MAG: 1-phosphofructokinase family hexose kinase [bacterium]|nr:1-phosphofructokinase family hexose kinase [bacterium]